MKKKSRRTTLEFSPKGREIVSSLEEAIAMRKSGIPMASRFTVRMVELPDEPGLYDASAVRGVRDLLGVSQPIFAHLLGVSAMLVRGWEQGQRKPAPWARRLLDEIQRDPVHWRGMLRRAS